MYLKISQNHKTQLDFSSLSLNIKFENLFTNYVLIQDIFDSIKN